MRSSTARIISSRFAGLRVRLRGRTVPLAICLPERYAGVSSTNRSVTSEDCMIAASALAGISVPWGNCMSTRTVRPLGFTAVTLPMSTPSTRTSLPT